MAGLLISISVVSHFQEKLVKDLLYDLSTKIDPALIEVILTRNVYEPLTFSLDDLPFLVKLVDNAEPKGFGANHNAAFRHAVGEWFCVMNPDIRLSNNPFLFLLEEIVRLQGAVIAPMTVSPAGEREDSMRHFPTLHSLAMKALGACNGLYDYAPGDPTFAADWVGGMFMLFKADAFRRVCGFDEGFFLYYEDVDICIRLWKAGGKVLACPSVAVVHDAQRTSRRQMRYMRWHASSMARYFAKHWLRLPTTSSAL